MATNYDIAICLLPAVLFLSIITGMITVGLIPIVVLLAAFFSGAVSYGTTSAAMLWIMAGSAVAGFYVLTEVVQLYSQNL